MSLALTTKVGKDFEPSLLPVSKASEASTGRLSPFVDETTFRESSPPSRDTFPELHAEGAIFIEVPVLQSHSVANSLDRFVALQYKDIPQVRAVHRQRAGDVISFYILLDADEEEALDATFERERFLYERFAGEGLDFQVLPGGELEPCVPSDAIPIWRR